MKKTKEQHTNKKYRSQKDWKVITNSKYNIE